MKSFLIHTIGCKVNQYDSEVIREAMREAGWKESEENPGVLVVNTCTVTATSDQKCRKLIRRLHRRFPQARIIVTGCYAERQPQALETIEGVHAVVPGRSKYQVVPLAEGKSAPPSPPEFFAGVKSLRGHSRAFVKIQDGCSNFCSYCIVPLVRGPVKSRNPDETVEEVRRLVASGFNEVVLTGIHLGAYGRDWGEEALPQLIETLCMIPGEWRLRLSSIEVKEVSDRLLDAMASSEKVCPHLHIPLQSGDDRILKLMNRSYTRREFLDTVQRVRAKLPEPGLTSDVMAGFPGEGEQEFESTLSLCRKAAFTRLHVFPFSPRPGTPAASFAPTVSAKDIRRRVDELCALAAELQTAFAETFLGREVTILPEDRRDKQTGMLKGYSERYVRVRIYGPDELKGKLIRARGLDVDDGILLAEPT